MARPSVLSELLALGRNIQMIVAATFKWQKVGDQQTALEFDQAASAQDAQGKRLAAVERELQIMILGLAELVSAVEAKVLASDQSSVQCISLLRELIAEQHRVALPTPVRNGRAALMGQD